METYDVGQQVQSTVNFRNKSTGAPVDPSTVVWKVRSPSGTETTYTYPTAEISKTGTGIYVGTFRVTEYGIWSSRWNGTGAAVGSDEDYVRGEKSKLESPI